MSLTYIGSEGCVAMFDSNAQKRMQILEEQKVMNRCWYLLMEQQPCYLVLVVLHPLFGQMCFADKVQIFEGLHCSMRFAPGIYCWLVLIIWIRISIKNVGMIVHVPASCGIGCYPRLFQKIEQWCKQNTPMFKRFFYVQSPFFSTFM